ncbi:MAG: DUF5060 domain-containing protein [Verrucomicrobiota bacterium]
MKPYLKPLAIASAVLGAIYPMAKAQDSVDCSQLPSSAPAQSSYSLSIPYTASVQRDIVVELWSDVWIANARTTVNAGSGTATITLNAGSVPADGSNYLWKASIRPVGGDWTQNLDLCQKTGVTLGSGGGGSGGSGDGSTGTGAWIESGGLVVIEPEKGELVSDWAARPSNYSSDATMAGSLGDGWLEWTGPFTGGNTIGEGSARGIITYTFEITTPGDYIFRWRGKQYSDVPSGDAGNDTYVRFTSGTPINGFQNFSSFTKVWVQSRNTWSWATNFEPQHGVFYNGDKARRNYTAGTHSIQLAGRSAGHAIDRIVLHRTNVGFNENSFNNLPESDREGGGTTFDAIDDFTDRSGGTANYYADNTYDALAVNPGNVSYDPTRFARASMTFGGDSGLYDLTITTLTEEDGECTYRLLVNGSVVRTYQNPRVGESNDLQAHNHTWQGITLVSGDTVSIESNAHSNNLITEAGPPNGYAWARGRWRTLSFSESTFTGDPVADAGPDKVIVLPESSVTLHGTANDEDGTLVSQVWSMVSGPNTPTMSGTPSLNLSNLVEGAYTFDFTATDNDGKSSSDEVLVNVIPPGSAAVVISGELKRWHKVTLTLDGLTTNENASPNPFYNTQFDVIFTHTGSGLSYRVPGYFAADGNAANSSASSGNKWRAHLSPDETGTWTYQTVFRQGTNAALNGPDSGSPVAPYHGVAGSFVVAENDKSAPDFRARGRLQYVGKHHLRFKGDGSYFLKAGADSPENLFAYEDFDNTPNTGGRRKSWSPHAGDYVPGDPTWAGGKGSELIGAVNYLASEGINVMSFLTYSYNGDDKNVFPHRTAGDYARMDCSKLDQWEIVLGHMQKKGIYLHFKTQETENDQNLDGGELRNQRKLYYRELVARFGHHLALNWNLGEETTNTTGELQSFAQWFHDNDPYRHHVVLHTYPNQQDQRYNPLLGNNSKLTGASVQTDKSKVFQDTKRWREASAATPRPWVVANDEQGPANEGIKADSNDAAHNAERGNVLWGNLMAGGAGIECYFGYQQPENDLTLQNFRSRANWWDQCRHALQFFTNNSVPFWDMANADNLISGSGNNANHCLALAGQTYVVYLRNGGNHTLNLSGAAGTFSTKWYDPRNGGAMVNGPTVAGGSTISLGSPPNATGSDWVALVESTTGGGSNTAPFVSAGNDKSAELVDFTIDVSLDGIAFDDGLPEDSELTLGWSRVQGPDAVSFADPISASTTASFSDTGTFVLRLTASDGIFTVSDDVQVTISAPSSELEYGAIHDAYLQDGTPHNSTDLRIESSSRVRTTYLQFSINPLPADRAGVKLRLTEGTDTSSGNMTLRVYQGLTHNWTETNLSSANAPAKGPELASFTGNIVDGQTIEFDLSSSVTRRGIYSFIVEADSSPLDLAFASKEAGAAVGPRIIVALPNEPPVFAGYTSAATAGASMQIPYADILANASDPDGDLLYLLEQSDATTSGGSVTMSAGILTYQAPAASLGTDTFPLTVSDGKGGTTTADLSVEVVDAAIAVDGSPPAFSMAVDGTPFLSFNGIPYLRYTVERSTGLIDGWSAIAVVVADASGLVSFEDPAPPDGQAFYRLSVP